MFANPTTGAVALLASALAFCTVVLPASADAVSDWAAKANTDATEQREPPRSRARTLAIVNVAMFEAVNAVSADRNTSFEAAAASAAHDVLVALYPDRASDLCPALAASLAGIANDVPKARGYLLGKDAAAAILALWFSGTRSLGAAAARPSRAATSTWCDRITGLFCCGCSQPLLMWWTAPAPGIEVP
jgi:hypothetical protein